MSEVCRESSIPGRNGRQPGAGAVQVANRVSSVCDPLLHSDNARVLDAASEETPLILAAGERLRLHSQPLDRFNLADLYAIADSGSTNKVFILAR